MRHAEPGSAIFRATFGEQAMWGATEHLLAGLVDLTNILVWFESKDGQKNQNRPKPVQRPGQKREGLTFGGGGVALSGEEFEAEWERRVAQMVADAESAANEEPQVSGGDQHGS